MTGFAVDSETAGGGNVGWGVIVKVAELLTIETEGSSVAGLTVVSSVDVHALSTMMSIAMHSENFRIPYPLHEYEFIQNQGNRLVSL